MNDLHVGILFFGKQQRERPHLLRRFSSESVVRGRGSSWPGLGRSLLITTLVWGTTLMTHNHQKAVGET